MAANSRFAMATHIMTSLALSEDELKSSNYLADSLNTNPVVVRRILGALQDAGLVVTMGGKAGGSRLAKKPSLVSLFDIYSAVGEGEIFAYNPNDPNKHCPLSCEMKSVLEPVFASARDAVEKRLKSVKLSELSSRVKK